MKFLVLAAVVVLATGQVPPNTAVEHHRNDSLLATLLEQAGFSQFCVSDALDQCSRQEKDGHSASLMEEIKGMVQEVILLIQHCKDSRDSGSGLQGVFPTTDGPPHATTQDSSPPRHCKDLLDSGDSESGLRDVFPDPDRPHHRVEVFCQQDIDGGGWTVFQRRSNGGRRESFERTWDDYKKGFGDRTREFWLGLENIHLLTDITEQELRVDLEDFEGGYRWAKYGQFYVGSQDTNYRLDIGRYSGNAGDAMTYSNGEQFSTHDADHDSYAINCAEVCRAGWWYKDCSYSNLNGYQHVGYYSPSSGWYEGIMWRQWRGSHYSLRRTTMMVRPAL